jgi:hypothetical protein
MGYMPFAWAGLGLAYAEVALARGDMAQAARLAGALADELRADHIDYWVPEARCLQGRALAGLDRLAEARAALQPARVEAQAYGARRLLWPILLALAEVEARSGAAEAAADLRQAARTVVAEMAAHTAGTLRASFLAQPHVRAALAEGAP